MALLKCPECGKENVSSVAEACPVCGYNIKQHYDRIEEEAAQRIMQEEEQRRIEQEKIQNYQRVYNSVEMPEKPKMTWQLIICMALLLFYVVIILVVFISGFADEGIVGLLFGSLIIALFTYGYWHDYKKKCNKYKDDLNFAQRDFDSYRKKRVEELLGLQKGIDELIKKQAAIREATCYICPNCGLRGGRTISSLKKGTSVAVFGIASNTLGKNYECDFCHYLW